MKHEEVFHNGSNVIVLRTDEAGREVATFNDEPIHSLIVERQITEVSSPGDMELDLMAEIKRPTELLIIRGDVYTEGVPGRLFINFSKETNLKTGHVITTLKRAQKEI